MQDEVHERYRRGFRPKDAFEDQKALCPLAGIIFDAGANRGYITSRYRYLFPDATIHAFEPFPAAFNAMEERFRTDGSVICMRKALSQHTGQATLYTNTMDVTNALMPFAKGAPNYLPEKLMPDEAILVETVSLDDYVAGLGIERINILKLDTQGSELDILNDARNLLRSHRIDLVYSELIFVPVYEGQCEFFEVAQFPGENGYRIYDFHGFVYDRSGQLKWGDAIFLPVDR